MSDQISAFKPQTITVTTPEAPRRSANFSPSIWGDYFLSYAKVEKDNKNEQHVQELKEELKRMLMAPVENLSEKLVLIEDIQRLGVFYHFENEIDETLQKIHENSSLQKGEDDEDLYTAALRFRLLRQQGYNVSCNMLKKFMNKDGKFQESLLNNAVGLLSLYDASHVSVHGEDILDEALSFTTTHLELAAPRLSPSLSKRVTHALHQPFWKGLPRIEARHYMSLYDKNDSYNETLLTLAKLDYNLMQQVHQKELSEITRWWKDLNFTSKLPFARDRVVECFYWATGTYFEPEYSLARKSLCKIIAIITVIDDIYDVQGTPEELENFAEAIERLFKWKILVSISGCANKRGYGRTYQYRWDISAMDQLPGYMKLCYQALLDIYTEIEERLSNEGNLYAIYHARESMKSHVRAYLHEARWFHQNYTPTSLDEYMQVAVSTSLFMPSIISVIGMGTILTKEFLDLFYTDPTKIVNSVAVIGRLRGDIESHVFEQKRGHISSAVECYIKEHGVTDEEAVAELEKQKNNAWKDLKTAWIHPTCIPRTLLLRPLNLARATEVMYRCEDGFTRTGAEFEGFVKSLFIDPVPA